MGLARKRKPRVYTPTQAVEALGVQDLFRILKSDLRESCKVMGRRECRFIVDLYYQVQDQRITLDHEARACEAHGESPRFLASFAAIFEHFENLIRASLQVFAQEYAVSRWCMAQVGVGPVITAGLIAEVDIRVAKTAGKLWRFAGLDPTVKWQKGQPRPYNAFLKSLCAFKLGESFVHTCNNPKSYYGRIYREAKERYQRLNEMGYYRETAQREMEEAKASGRWRKLSADGTYLRCWQEGKLPPAHIHARARRKAVQVFLSHLHEVMYRDYYSQEPPSPYILVYEPEKHTVRLDPQGWPCDGRPLRELYALDERVTAATKVVNAIQNEWEKVQEKKAAITMDDRDVKVEQLRGAIEMGQSST